MLPSATPESVGLSSERLARIGIALESEIDQGNIPGEVVMIARRGKLVYTESFGYRDKAAGVPMTKDAIFRIYSMTKPLVSVAAMTLVEDGRLQLTDPVSKFLPAFRYMQVSVAQTDAEFAKVNYSTASAAREMTVQDLLRHTAGLAYGEISQNAPVKKAYLDAGISMMLNGGRRGDTRVLSRTTVALMTSDSLGTRIAAPVTPGELLLGTPGYTFGLGFAVRQAHGIAGVHGSAGEFMWGGYAGAYFWVDPKEELVAVYMSQATRPTRPYYRRLVKNLTYQAIVD